MYKGVNAGETKDVETQNTRLSVAREEIEEKDIGQVHLANLLLNFSVKSVVVISFHIIAIRIFR